MRLPARIEVISNLPTAKQAGNPITIVDVAHNPVSISALVKSIKETFDYNRLLLIFGASQDKDIKNMIKILIPITDKIIFTKAGHPRALSPDILKKMASQVCNIQSMAINNVTRAIEVAKMLAKKDDIILITGSFYLVGDALSYYGNAKLKIQNHLPAAGRKVKTDLKKGFEC